MADTPQVDDTVGDGGRMTRQTAKALSPRRWVPAKDEASQLRCARIRGT